MNWAKSLEGALLAAGVACVAAAQTFYSDGMFTQSELVNLGLMFVAVFLAYLKTHAPEDNPGAQ